MPELGTGFFQEEEPTFNRDFRIHRANAIAISARHRIPALGF